MPILPPLKSKAIQLCRTVTRDSATGLLSLHDVFDTFSFPNGLPGTTKPFVVYLALTNGEGRYDLNLVVQELNDNTDVLIGDIIPVIFRDRISVEKVDIRWPPFVFKRSGAYDMVALANGDEIDRITFFVLGPGESRP